MANQVTVTFLDGTEGLSKNDHIHTDISFTNKGFAPYELFLSGYASCLHATFMGIAQKMRLSYESVKYDVTGEKRDEVPTFLKTVHTSIVFTGVDPKKEEKIIKAMEKAERYCSISAMISQFAKMTFNYTFD